MTNRNIVNLKNQYRQYQHPLSFEAVLQAGKIDALWRGASLPIPVIKQVADSADAVVFGLDDSEVAAML